MDPKRDREGADDRHEARCAYCGNVSPDSRDHTPSKVFLDEPYPQEMNVVGSCSDCNQSFSMDEEYLACFIECVCCGNMDNVEREKIQKTLKHNKTLKSRIFKSRNQDLFGDSQWNIEMDRAKNVILKLARGHAAFTFYPMLENKVLEHPDSLLIFPLLSLTPKQLNEFESIEEQEMLPEIGTRAFNRHLVISPNFEDEKLRAKMTLIIFEYLGDWITVQENRYRYAITANASINIKIVIREYLAANIVWR